MDRKSIALLLTGDFMITRDYLAFKKIHNLSYEYPFVNLINFFKSSDIIFSNLECSLSRSGSPMRPNTGPQLYSPPDEVLPTYRYLNCNVVSIGNNHINDFGENAIIETKSLLEDNGLCVFGAGKDILEAKKEKIIEKNNIKLAFLGYTTDTDVDGVSPDIGASIATADSAGCVYYDTKNIQQDIERVSTKADIICISIHWGFENITYPSPKQIELAHQIIDAGAHVIIGHHPHVVQGIEEYKHGVIFYSLGNFFFWNYWNMPECPNECNEFLIGLCEICKSGVKKIELFPGIMNDKYQLKLLDNKDRESYVQKVNSLSETIYRKDYINFWEDHRKERDKYFSRLLIKATMFRLLWKMSKMGLKDIYRKTNRKTIQNCASLLAASLRRAL